MEGSIVSLIHKGKSVRTRQFVDGGEEGHHDNFPNDTEGNGLAEEFRIRCGS